MLKDEVREYLASLDKKGVTFEYHDIATKIRELIKAEDPRSTEDEAEIFAFNIYTSPDGATTWDSYFGPMMSFADKDGNPIDFPSRQNITTKMLDYWGKRMVESANPLLKARYADLLIEFSKDQKRRLDIKVVRNSINAHLGAVKESLVTELEAKDSMGRAVYLAKKFNQHDLIPGLLEQAIQLEKEIGKDEKPGLWGFVMEWFVLDPTVEVPAERQMEIIEDLRARHKRLLEAKALWPLKSATILLAHFHKNTGDRDSLRQILLEYQKLVRESGEFKESGLGALHNLQSLEELYLQFNVGGEVSADLQVIQNDLKKFRVNTGDFKEISAEVSVPKEKIDTFIKGLFKDSDLLSVALNVVREFLLRPEKEKKSLDEISKRFVFAHIVTGNVFDGEDRLIAQIPPINEAPEKHLRTHSSQNLDFSSLFLQIAYTEFTKRYTLEGFAAFLKQSICFSELSEEHLNKVLQYYWTGDYFGFVHTVVPLIEAGIRRLLIVGGIAVTKSNKEGGYDYRSLNSLLDSDHANLAFQQLFNKVGPDVLYTLRLILIDPLGKNIRNRVAHGIRQVDFIERGHADKLMFSLMILGIIQLKRKSD